MIPISKKKFWVVFVVLSDVSEKEANRIRHYLFRSVSARESFIMKSRMFCNKERNKVMFYCVCTEQSCADVVFLRCANEHVCRRFDNKIIGGDIEYVEGTKGLRQVIKRQRRFYRYFFQ